MRSVAHNLQTSPFLLVIWMWTCSTKQYSCIPQVIRSYAGQPRSTEVKWGKMRSMTFADFFRVILPSKVIWGADFDWDIHFVLRKLEMRSWNHRVIQGQWRHMTRKWFFDFSTPKNYPWALKTIVACSTRRKEHAGRWNFALAPSETKLSAITGFVTFRHLTWPQRSLVDLGP